MHMAGCGRDEKGLFGARTGRRGGWVGVPGKRKEMANPFKRASGVGWGGEAGVVRLG